MKYYASTHAGTWRAKLRLLTALARCTGLLVLALHSTTAATLTFEGLDDLQPVDRFYEGVVFSHAVAAVAGFSLNEVELPPASGSTVALNDAGPMEITWVSPVIRFEALFTYTGPLTLTFFLKGIQVGSTASMFGNNLALSGEPGSSPNEPSSFVRTNGFNSVRIDSAGAFGVDDVTSDIGSQAVPEPATTMPFLLTALLLLCGRFGPLESLRRSRSDND